MVCFCVKHSYEGLRNNMGRGRERVGFVIKVTKHESKAYLGNIFCP